MGAPKGNEFYKLRATVGRGKIFESPTEMWNAACQYFKWCEDNPLLEHDYVGKDAIEVEKRKIRAFTMHGLCRHLGVNTHYFIDFEAGIKDKKDKKSKAFSDVIKRIRDVVYEQKFTYAAAGFLNPNIIARDLGLTDKKELAHSGEAFAPQITVKRVEQVTNKK